MIIDSKKYSGTCTCGKDHSMTTEFCIIEPGCMKNIGTYIEKYGIAGSCAAIYDENTYSAFGGLRPVVGCEVVLPPENLHADNHAVAETLKKLPPDSDYLIALGSGTVHDITRYCAYKMGIPFVSCPSAASVDGFCSSVAAMTWDGFKKTFTAAAPKIVVADLDVISKAPFYLTKSGVGDVIGKYIALAEWKLGRLMKGEYFCMKIYNLTVQAVQAVKESVENLADGDVTAYEKLTYGLLISGIAMQLLGNSRCASGAEHHISHLIEMQPKGLNAKSDALHGERVGVGTLIAAREYHAVTENDDNAWSDYPKIDDEYIADFFGDKLCQSIIDENKNDTALGIHGSDITANMDGIRKIISEIPSVEDLSVIYKRLNMKSTLDDIGVDGKKESIIKEYSPLVRNRLTLMRLRRCGF